MAPAQGGSVPEARADTVRARYDTWSSQYDQDTARFGWCAPQTLIAAMSRHQRPAAALRVLDLGVGTGQVSAAYLEVGAAVTGLDLSTSMLDIASKQHRGFFRLVRHDLDQPLAGLGFTPGRFDSIVAAGVLHFVTDLERLCRELAEQLCEGGYVAFTYVPPQPHPFSPATVVRTPREVEAMLDNAGLERLEHEEFVAYHEGADPDDPVVYRLIVAKKRGAWAQRNLSSLGLDRTACIDRERVRELAASAPEMGPIGLEPPEIAVEGGPRCDVLVVTAHPDDESIYVGGTLASLRGEGHRIVLLCLTDGAGGRKAMDGETSLSELRHRELDAACLALGVEAHEVAGLPDFGKTHDALRERPYVAADALERWGESALDLVVDAIQRHRPRVLLSFEPTRDPNYSLHAHHLATGELCRVAFPRADWRPQVQLAVVHPEDARKSERGFVRELSDEAAASKRRAIEAHASQAFSSQRLLRPGSPALVREAFVVVQARDAKGGLDFGSPGWCRPRRFPDGSPLPLLRAGHGELRALYRQPPDTRPAEERCRVVAGQQVGLFGGPALVLAKACAAVALAEARGGEAMFWLATQDHDHEEIGHADLWSTAGRTRLRWSPDANRGRAVSTLRFGPEIAPLVDQLRSHLEGPHAEAVGEAVARAYVPGASPASAFASLLGEALEPHPIRFIDPCDDGLAECGAGLIRSVLEDGPRVLQVLAERRNHLESLGVRAPVQRSALPVFFHQDDGRRVPIEEGSPMPNRELLRVHEREPGRFTPDVLLRPAWQDAVLEPSDSIAGPTEFAYWGQAFALHEHLGVDASRLWLRPSFDVLARAPVSGGPSPVEADVARLRSLLTGNPPAGVIRAAIESLPLLVVGGRVGPRMQQTIDTDLPTILAELGRAADGSRRDLGRVIRRLVRWERSLRRDHRRRQPSQGVDLGRVPGGPQDRRVWWIQLWAHHGPGLISTIIERSKQQGASAWQGLHSTIHMDGHGEAEA